MSTEIAEKAGEIAGDLTEEAVDGVVEVVEVFRNNPAALAGAGVVGLGLGVVGGYFLAKKLLESKYEQELTEEIATAKEYYATLNKVDVTGRPLSPQEVMDKLHGEGASAEALKAHEVYQGRIQGENPSVGDDQDEEQLARTQSRVIKNAELHSVNLLAEEPDPKMGTHPIERVEQKSTTVGDGVVVQEKSEINVFKDPTFDMEEELKHRTPDAPYIITHDEFFSGEYDYDTVELVYYRKDDTLVDEQEHPIDDLDLIGPDHLVRFGSGSKDINKVYIRNDKNQTDYAITQSQGSYLHEVLDLKEDPDSLQHSGDDRRRARAFRRGDE